MTMPSSCTCLDVAAKELVERWVDDLARTGINRHLQRPYGDNCGALERALRKGATVQLARLAYGH